MPSLGYPHCEPDVDCPFHHTGIGSRLKKAHGETVGLVEHYQST
jgi:hypothetical protein